MADPCQATKIVIARIGHAHFATNTMPSTAYGHPSLATANSRGRSLRKVSRNRSSAPPRPTCQLRPTGSVLIRCPVAAKMALQSAGATGGTPGSPTPPDVAELGTTCTWISRGAASIRTSETRSVGRHRSVIPDGEVGLLGAAALEGDLARERIAQAHDRRPLHLRPSAVGIGNESGVNRHVHARNGEGAIGATWTCTTDAT